MKPGLQFTKIWFDDDVVELRVDSSDGTSLFSNTVYVGHADLADVVAGLDRFKDHIHGGLFEMRFGEFGPEYANGAFHARLHFQERGKIRITVKAQSGFHDFGGRNVASDITLYLVTEPALLDNFISELSALKSGATDEAKLVGA